MLVSSFNIKAWLTAVRLRTLPLALSSIGMGGFLAYSVDIFNLKILALCALTTVLLQILSNLANDYGDSQHGADLAGREGPVRTVQSGVISATTMKKAIIIFISLSFLSGVWLLLVAFGRNYLLIGIFLLMGGFAIWASVNYTSGSRPYGYTGFGDLSVLIFFGIVGVMGTFFLHTGLLQWQYLLPSLSCGLFATAVLNINNIRDIHSDKLAGKLSVPVRIGRKKAVIYHWTLLSLGIMSAVIFTLINYQSLYQFFFLLTIPLIMVNGLAISRKTQAMDLDPYLKQMVLSTLLFVITFGLGLILS